MNYEEFKAGVAKIEDESDRADAHVAASLMMEHLAGYYGASEELRVTVLAVILAAEKEFADILSHEAIAMQWRHKWPKAVRSALLALWSTPRDVAPKSPTGN